MTTKKEQHVDPWHAEAAEGEDKIDYDKLISKKEILHIRRRYDQDIQQQTSQVYSGHGLKLAYSTYVVLRASTRETTAICVQLPIQLASYVYMHICYITIVAKSCYVLILYIATHIIMATLYRYIITCNHVGKVLKAAKQSFQGMISITVYKSRSLYEAI